ncbi:F-box protein CPR1-like [Silene latifolia]|uniref:F-box protein CPR1-like n=1 Tax=Silene latifolia TaxID=37657 RepID=UPI003D782328
MLDRRVPLDLILEILSLLPAKSILRFKCICKEWYNLIDSPLFTNLHLNKSLEPNSRHNRALFCTSSLRIVYDINHPLKSTKLYWPSDMILYYRNTDVVGSCNGLVCFKVCLHGGKARRDHNQPVFCFLICNLATRTFKSILLPSEKTWMNHSLSYGFGYDNEQDDYKIVVTSSVWMESDRDVRIFSLKADSWSYPTPTRTSSERIWENRKNVIFRDKMLHYLVSANDGMFGVSKLYKIARFDVVSEKWADDLSFPSQLRKDLVELGELDGQLYLRVSSFSTHDIWMLEEDGSWKKMFQLPRDLLWHRLIARSKDGHNRLLLEDYNDHGELKWYDEGDNRRIPFKEKQLPKYESVMIYIPSLVKIPGCSLTKLLG